MEASAPEMKLTRGGTRDLWAVRAPFPVLSGLPSNGGPARGRPQRADASECQPAAPPDVPVAGASTN